MPTHRQHEIDESFYFVTFTCYKWLSLIEKTNLYDHFLSWSKNLGKKGIRISGYVIMPNHVHMLVYVMPNVSLNKEIGNAKRFLAYEIVNRLKGENELELLQILSEGVQPEEVKKGKKHQVFRLSFDGKLVQGEDEIHKVLSYMHRNPCEGKWQLAEDYLEYPYSSAQFYELGKRDGVMEVIDYRDMVSDVCS